MGLSNTLLLHASNKKIAFSGGKDRELLIHRLSDELVRAGHPVLITNIDAQKVPLANSIVVSKNIKLLPRLIREELQKTSKIYFGKALQQDKVVGFQPQELAELGTTLQECYLLIDLGGSEKNFLPDPRKLKKALKSKLWDQLIITFELKILNQTISDENLQKFATEKSSLPEAGSLREDLFLRFLSDKKNGLGFLFAKNNTTLFLFTDIEYLSLANRAISIAREAVKQGIHTIGYIDWETNLIKMIGQA